MIRIVGEGNYKLIETKTHHKILYLKRSAFAWIGLPKDGEMLVLSNVDHHANETIAIGRYQVFHVAQESNYTDLLHLELEVGNGHWQGYLLPTGFPTSEKKRSQIIATTELIHDKLLVSPGSLNTTTRKPSFMDVI